MKQAIATPSRTRDILKKYDLSAKKSLGQNFIIDPNIMENIINIAGIDKQTAVIEVGPGIGALTQFLAEYGQSVLSLEIDQRFLPVLAEELKEYENITVVEGDALKLDLKSLIDRHLSGYQRLVLVANLPYYVTTPILMHFLQADIPLDAMTIMVQKEVAERLSASPSTKAYGSLSIAVQYEMEVELAAVVPPTVFIPAPNVDSAIIQLEKRANKKVEVENEDFFFGLVRRSFAQRRKTLRNNLINAFGKENSSKEKIDHAMAEAGLDPKIRGEALDIQQFASLSQALENQGLDTDDFKS